MEGPDLFRPVAPHLLPLLGDPPLFRPRPPFDPVPQPPIHDTGYIPVPPGIRAVYTTHAVLPRGQPEMNHPARMLRRPDPRIPGQFPNIDPGEVTRRRVALLDNRPEINPIARWLRYH